MILERYFQEIPSFDLLVVSLGTIIISILLGILQENFVIPVLEKICKKTKSPFDDLVVNSVKGFSLLWSLLVGCYIVLKILPFQAPFEKSIEKILVVILIISLVLILGKIIDGFFKALSKQKRGMIPSNSILVNIIKIILYITGLLSILQFLGISVFPILTALGVGGLAVALAMQETLSNLFAGIQLLLSNQVHIGNYVKLSTGEEGHLMDIGWRNTVMKTQQNNIIIIPNSKMASTNLTNYQAPDTELSIVVNLGVSYDSDLDRVEKITLEVARDIMRNVAGGVPAFEPGLSYSEFGDSAIKFSVILRGKEYVNQYLIKHEFIKRLHKRYAKEGINIPFPAQTIYFNNMQEKTKTSRKERKKN